MKFKPVQSKYLISVHQPQLVGCQWLCIIAGIALLVWSAFEYGRDVAGFDQSDYDQEIEVLQQSLDRTNRR